MANPYNNGQVTWNANEINAARNWFSAGKSATDTQARANELGLSNTQLENLWNVSMGPNGGTNPFTRSTTATQAPGTTTTQGTGASHPDLTQTVYNTPNGVTDGANPYNQTAQRNGWQYGDGSLSSAQNIWRGLGATDAERDLAAARNGWHLGGLNLVDPTFPERQNGASRLSDEAQRFMYDRALAGDRAQAQQQQQSAIQRYVGQGLSLQQAQDAVIADNARANSRALAQQQPAGAGGMLSQSINMGNGQWNVTPDQLVENRLQNLLDDDNPLVQMARTQGLQDAQSRGLLNSSLGAQAGALAAYQYAMPVAQQDATTYGNAARTNAENAVQMQMQQAGFGHDADMARINEGVQSRLSAQGAQQELARLNQAHRNTLSQTSVQQRNWMQQSYLSQMNNYQNSLAQYTQRIQEADMPADQKTAQINELMQTYSNLINWSNASYGQMPQWVSQWSTLAPTIESR